MSLRFGSICSGIEAASVAWKPLGWQCAFVAEIEAFPSAVLTFRHRGAANIGDMTKIDGNECRGLIDVLVGGTPCQAFSVAGQRRSLDDARGNLTLKFVEIVHAANPEFVVWENVPGVLSTNDNAFGCFLAGLVGATEPLVSFDESGSWPSAGMVAGPTRTAAWRILDAQYFGLAQRRRRVFVVSCRTGDGHNPGAILFEPESLPRDSAPSRETGQRVAASLTRGADSSGNGGYAGRRQEDEVNIVHALRADGFDASEDGTGRGTPIIPIDMRQASRGATMTNNRGDDVCSGGAPGTGIGEDGDPAPSLSVSHTPAIAFGWNKSSHQTMRIGDTTDSLQGSPSSNPAIAIPILEAGKRCGTRNSARDGIGVGDEADPMFTLQANAQHAVGFAQNQRDELREMDVAGALAGEPGMKQQTYAREGMAVRRLTPRECERLQGFPDDYTLITYKNKPASDGPRYRALGNSMAVPVMRWIGQRIEKFITARKAAAA